MRYRRLKVSNFRGVDSREVHFGEGVTVVWGPNESGKSSLREAIELLRDVKDSSNAARVRQVKPVHRDAAPTVELEMEAGPYELIYRKQWLRSRETVLTVTQAGIPSHYTGAQAEARFNELLEETVDSNLLRELDVKQGTSLIQPRLANIKALHKALGDSPEQDSTDSFMESVEAEYLKYFTRTGQPGKDLREARARLEEARESLAEAEKRYLDVEGLSIQFRENRTRIVTLGKQLEDAERRLNEALAKEKKIQAARELLETHGENRKRINVEVDRLEFAADQRRKAAIELGQLREEETALKARVARNRELLEAAVQRTASARSELDAARSRDEQARIKAYELEKSLATLRDHQELQTLTRRAKQVEESFSSIEKAQQALSANPATQERLERVWDAQREVELAEARVLAAAPRIRVEAFEDTAVSVLSKDTAATVTAGEPLEAEAASEVTVDVPGVVSVRISPGASVEDLDLLVEDARTALDAALLEVGARTVPEAASLGERRRAAQADLDHARAVFASAQDGSSREELQTRIATLKGRLGSASEGTAAPEAGQDRDTLEASVHVAQHEYSASSAAVVQCQTALELAQRKEATSNEEEVELRMASANLSTRIELVEKRLSEDENEGEDEGGLAQELASLKLQAERVTAQMAECKQTLEDLDPERTTAELSNLRELVPSKRLELEEARTNEVVLSTKLDERTAEGLFDSVQQCEIERNQAQAAWERISARSSSVQMLWATLAKHKAEAQRKYVAPLQDGLNDLGRLVFGRSFSVQVSPELEIVSRTVDGITIAFDELSVGAQEQLSLLGRLAVARMVDPLSSAPVILDDTLGFADPERLASLNLVLNTAGKDAQIIVLTCQPDRFQNIGGAKTVQLENLGLEATDPE